MGACFNAPVRDTATSCTDLPYYRLLRLTRIFGQALRGVTLKTLHSMRSGSVRKRRTFTVTWCPKVTRWKDRIREVKYLSRIGQQSWPDMRQGKRFQA